MNQSLTRRQWASTVVASAAAAPLAAQPANDLDQAQEDVVRHRETLAKFPLPMSVEPAFQFKA